MSSRRISQAVRVGNLLIGGDNPIRVQSMATTSTLDTPASVAQAVRIIQAGGELVRFTTQGTREAENMRHISRALKAKGFTAPLVADVHFNPRVAEVAALHCEKVRINPGNFVDPARRFRHISYTDEQYAAELRRLEQRLLPLLDLCRQHGTALRIGVNHGSLSDRIMSRYGDTPEGIVESCMEFLRVCVRHRFPNVVVSIKASNTVVMVRSVRLLVQQMQSEGMAFPLHLGVTEAGEGEDGRIRSAVGIGALLTEGIGDTIRVSLSEPPEAEIPVALKMVRFIDECALLRQHPTIQGGRLLLSFRETDREDLQLKASMAAGALLIDGAASDLTVLNFGQEDTSLADAILQAARLRFTRTEFISCPGCGRTLYNLPQTVARIKSALQQAALTNPRIRTLRIAVMGCIVNGPGEMADADYGYVGAARGRVSLYKGKQCLLPGIPEAEAVTHLLRLIEETETTES